MRKALAVILLLLYTLTSTGATVYYHQCGAKAQISLSEENTTHGSCKLCIEEEQHHDCGQESHSSCNIEEHCCNDVQIELKSTDEQLSAFNFLQDFSPFIHPVEFIVPWILTAYPNELVKSDQNLYAFSSAPPQTNNSTYILVCNFRI